MRKHTRKSTSSAPVHKNDRGSAKSEAGNRELAGSERVPQDITFAIRSRRVTWIVGSIVAFLALAGTLSAFFKVVLQQSTAFGFVPLFDLDREANVPSWYSSLAILCCATLLATIVFTKRKEQDPHYRAWRLLAATFLLLSLDEAASLHELSMPTLRRYLHTSGVFYFAWVIPGALFVLAVFLRMLKLLRDLDRQTRQRFLVAGAVYVAGALGMEMIGGAYTSASGGDFYYAFAIVEETLEMVGILLFLHALLCYVTAHMPRVTLTFKE
jgi:hypothetical protein